MVKKGATVSAKLCNLQLIFSYTKYKTQNMKYKNFLHKVARSWISQIQI